MDDSGAGTGAGTPPDHDPTVAQSYIARCEAILAEIDYFAARLHDLRRTNRVELRPLQSAIRADLKALARIAASDCAGEELAHRLRSSNIAFYESVWSVAKASHGVVAFLRAFSGDPRQQPHRTKPNRARGSVDVVTDNGATWIKVGTISERSLIFDIAKQGWELDASDASGSDNDDDDDDNDDDDDIPLLRTARDLAAASEANRIHFRNPRVKLILPNIQTGRVDAIDQVLARIRKLGVEVVQGQPTAQRPIEQACHNMLVNDFDRITDTVNVDCTILLALVSDLSNAHVEKEPWLHTATKRQIEMEESENLLPCVLYPALVRKELVATRMAVKRMLEIVATIGTETEKARTQSLLDYAADQELCAILDLDRECSAAGNNDDNHRSSSRRAAFTQLSDHAVPDDFELPVKVVDATISTAKDDGLPDIAETVATELSELNRSVFMYGWKERITTITSNRATVKFIDGMIGNALALSDAMGPDIWLCEVPRSLRAKDKLRKS